MLRIRQSNRLDRLADDLIGALAAPTGAHPLEPEQVVVQSPGMATWLRHRLAEHAGIAAAVDFPLPAALVWSVVRALVPEAQETSPYGKRPMAWRLMALLDPEQGQLAGDPRFRSLLDYLEDDDSGLERHQLAQRVADVFDQYLVYRPDWMIRWRDGSGDDDPVARAEPWQPELWRRLVAASGDAPDRAALQARACHRLEQDPDVGELLRRHLPPRLMVFGISAMPPEQLRLLLGLARHIEVRVLVFNPCSQFWSDIVSERYLARLVADETARDEAAPTHPYYDTGHPLLASLGTAGRDFIDLLLELGPDAEPEDAFEPPAGDSMLATLQRDILELDADAAPVPLAADDHSIRFSDCHGPLRELEALHDWLLARFEADPELRPRDIVVMIPDIDRYAPCVEAVFGQSGDPALQIPYAISDRGQRGEAPILGAVAALLRLPRSRLPVSELLGILETPAVLRAFGLDETDLEQIAWWLEATGVRWGRDGDHWRRLGFEPPDAGEGAVANTWAFGTERMLLGYAMGGEGDAADGAGLFRDTLPLAGVEGAGAEAVGALLSFLDRVDEFRHRLAGPHPASAWARLLRELLDAFLDPDEDEALALAGIHQLIAEFAELEDSAGLTEPLSLDVIEAALDPVLQAPGGGHRFLAGQLTFCTLMPMRTIPFRVVALLGMNDGDYPRREVPLGFDLLARFPRKGDRARRLEDRYLFLEAVLAAREHLYVSWSGRSPTDDSVQPPSVVVAELREALARRFRVPESGERLLEAVTLRHPLQPFSPEYGRRLRTYSDLWAVDENAEHRRGSGSVRASSGLPEPEPETRLPLQALTALFLDPPGRFLAERLDVHLGLEEVGVDDDEPFVLGGLDRYRVRSEALRALRAGDDARDWIARERRSGRLPHGVAGEEALAAARGVVESCRERLGSLLDHPATTLALEAEIDGVRIAGEVGDCLDSQRLVLRAGKAKARDWMRLWIEHLLLAAAGRGRPGLLADQNTVVGFGPVAPDAAHSLLADLLAARRAMLAGPVPLLADSACEFARRCHQGKEQEQALNAARNQWLPGWNGIPGEGDRPATARLWPRFPGDDPARAEDFVAWSLRVWGPLHEALTTFDDDALVELAAAEGGPDGD